MSGIYIHIPFCKVKCSYCNFYKTTDNSRIDDLVKAIKLEFWLRKDYLHDQQIQTIYFGGGTPSLLNAVQLHDIIRSCNTVLQVKPDAEITIEANPDDLNLTYLETVKAIGVNRLSIGIQSFSQADLKLMKRRHNPIQAINAVKLARQAGFKNISVDLIYGVPGMSFSQWKENLDQVFGMQVEHVSAYHLTYHKGTQLWNDLQKGVIQEIDEAESVKQYQELISVANKFGFIHYEISNFAREGYFSRHNSSYWNQTEYLGLGPSAHSFDKNSRQWNVASLNYYLLSLKNGKIPFKREKLSNKDRFNDYIITTLRTIWGANLKKIESDFGKKYSDHVTSVSKKYLDSGQVIKNGESIYLVKDGWFVSDSIMTDFML